MINVIVSYKIKEEFIEQNKNNIRRFLDDFKKLDTANFQYAVYTKEDGVTFVHHSTYKDEKAQTELLNIPSFKEFQKLRDESGLDNTHKVEVLTYFNSVHELLK